MTALRTRGTAAAVVGLLTLALAGCSADAGDDELFAYDTLAPAAPADPAGLAPLLLTVSDITLPGWVAYQPTDDNPGVDDETGGICTLDFTDLLTPEQLATEQDSDFANQSQATIVAESLWAVPAADDLVATMASQFAACVGPYNGTSGDSAVVVTSDPVDITVPGATASVCRTFQTSIDAGAPIYGAVCLASSGDRLLGLLAGTQNADGGVTQADYVAFVTAASAKAFAVTQ